MRQSTTVRMYDLDSNIDNDPPKMINSFAVTLDIDWAPDFIINEVAGRLLEKKVKATWFVTHKSPALDMLRHHPDLFELGIHPNFKAGSSHGSTTEQVFEFFQDLVPEAVSVRSHGLIQSDYLWRYLVEFTNIKVDCTTYLAHAQYLVPTEFFWKGKKLVRAPFFYQDNIEMEHPRPVWRADKLLDQTPGVKIMNFHPIYIYLNAHSMRGYERIAAKAKPFQTATEADVNTEIEKSEGAGTMFNSVLDHLSGSGNDSWIRSYA